MHMESDTLSGILVIVAVLVGIVLLILFLIGLYYLGYFILRRLLFKCSNEDKAKLRRFEERIDIIVMLGDRMRDYRAKYQSEVTPLCINVLLSDTTVKCTDEEFDVLLTKEERNALFILAQAFGDTLFDRIVFQDGRIGFYSKACWNGLIYAYDGKKPKYYENYNESFRFRRYEMKPNWYLLLA